MITTNQSDLALLSFLNSATEGEMENALEMLMVKEIKPVIEKTLRFKMHVSLTPTDFSQTNQDALELFGEINVLIVSELRKLKSNNEKTIQNLSSYVSSVTTNVYRQYLRKKYPLRRQLKNKLQYLLTHHPKFALWEDKKGWLCGLKQAVSPSQPLDIETVKTKIRSLVHQNNLQDSGQTVELVRTCFEVAESSIFLNDLISIVAAIQGIEDPKEIGGFEENLNVIKSLIDSDNGLVHKIEQQEELNKVWSGICEMPVRHRLALLLNLKSRDGDGVITLFPVLRIATIRQIAAALEFSPEEFADIWAELPWEDIKIAEYMKLTRQQVINLRQSARIRLIREAK